MKKRAKRQLINQRPTLRPTGETMRKTPEEMPIFKYPVFCSYDDSVVISENPSQICCTMNRIVRRSFEEAQQGKVFYLDSGGIYAKPHTYVRVPWFGGIVSFISSFTSQFFVPILSEYKQLPLNEYKRKMSYAVRRRYYYDTDKEPLLGFLEALKAADSYEACFKALPGEVAPGIGTIN